MRKVLLKIIKQVYKIVVHKHQAELRYWKRCLKWDGGHFDNGHYQKLFLAMAGETNTEFIRGKVVADFGCGPRGSLKWAVSAAERIGMDVLAEQYRQAFPEELAGHGMLYLTCTEESIPLPDNAIDILFTLNALDHVKHLSVMCREIKRILKPGGWLIGSFNLNQKPTLSEPQMLKEDSLKRELFGGWHLASWRVSAPNLQGYWYQPLLDNRLLEPKGGPAILWVRAQKPQENG